MHRHISAYCGQEWPQKNTKRRKKQKKQEGCGVDYSPSFRAFSVFRGDDPFASASSSVVT